MKQIIQAFFKKKKKPTIFLVLNGGVVETALCDVPSEIECVRVIHFFNTESESSQNLLAQSNAQLLDIEYNNLHYVDSFGKAVVSRPLVQQADFSVEKDKITVWQFVSTD
jgi:hypothetical protein